MGRYLVTGAAGGMGAALCRALAEAGHSVWGLDLKTDGAPEGVRLLQADLRSAASVGDCLEQVRREAGTLNGIVHMAGIYDLNSLAEMPEEDFVRDFDVNVFGAFRVNRAFLPLLEKGSRIVVVTSELAPLSPLPFTGIYAVTKGALERYAESLRAEVQLLGHSVTVVRPGAVDTGMLPVSTKRLDDFCENTRLYSVSADRFRNIVNGVESRSVKPEEIGRAVLRVLDAPRPPLTVDINRNPWLRLLDALPARLRLRILRRILSQ